MLKNKILFFVFVFSFFSLLFGEEEKSSETNGVIDDEFYSIQSSAITVCYGDRWFLEETDDAGKIIYSVLYEKDKLIEKKEFEYTDGYKSGVNIFLLDKLVKIKYNKAGYEIEKETYDKSGNKLLKKITNKYDENNLLKESLLIKDGTEYLTKFSYGKDKKKLTQTDFVNNQKVCFIEFKKTKKIIRLFQFDKEIKVWEEEL